jgi:hypothetical protein
MSAFPTVSQKVISTAILLPSRMRVVSLVGRTPSYAGLAEVERYPIRKQKQANSPSDAHF